MKKKIMCLAMLFLFLFGTAGCKNTNPDANPTEVGTVTQGTEQDLPQEPEEDIGMKLMDAGGGLITWEAVEGASHYEIDYQFAYGDTRLGNGGIFYRTKDNFVRLYIEGVELHVRAVMGAEPGEWSKWFTYGQMSAEGWDEVCTYNVEQMEKALFKGIRNAEEEEPAEESVVTEVPEPTVAPAVTETPAPTAAPDPTTVPAPTAAPDPTTVPAPTAAPDPTETPAPTATPEPTATPKPTATPEPTEAPKPTATPGLIRDIKTDKTVAEVYTDDTTVTYTISTAAEVEEVSLVQVEARARNYNEIEQYVSDTSKYEMVLNCLTVTNDNLTNSFVVSEDGFTKYAASRKINGEEAVWTIRWDLGNTAVKFIRVEAKDAGKDTVEEAYLKLNIHYPVLDYREGFEQAVFRFVEENLQEPFFFKLDPATITDTEDYRRYFSFNEAVHIYDDEITILAGMIAGRSLLEYEDAKYDEINYGLLQYDNEEFYRYRFSLDPVYSGGLMDYLSPTSMFFSSYYTTENTHEQWSPMKRNVLLSHYEEGATLAFHADMSDDMRAIIAYRNGYSIDKEKFPFAHSVLERATKVLDEIIDEGMTDFEKEHAIYQWMIENYYNGLEGNTSMDVEMIFHITKTAYGLLNGYHGDCSGWSATFYTLCNMAGVPCTFVDCMATAGGITDNSDDAFAANHRVNLVMIEDEFYYVEVFWFYQKLSDTLGDWRYFNMTSEEAAEHYTWLGEEYFGAPETNAKRYKVDEHTGELLNK